MSSLPPPPDDLPEPEGGPAEGLEPPAGAISGSWPGPPVDAPSPFTAPGGGAFAPPGAVPPSQFPPPPGQYPAPPTGALPPPPGPGLPAPPGGWIQPAAYGEAPPPQFPPPQFPPGGPADPYAAGYQAYRPGMRPAVNYAGFWARLGGSFLDGLIVGVVPVILYVVGIFSAPQVAAPCPTYTGAGYVCTEPDFDKVVPFVLAAIALYLVLLFFLVVRPIGTTGQSIGMKAVGVRVVDAGSGRPIGVGRALGRHLVTWLMSLCSIVSLLGYLWMLWDDRKQTLHDKAVSAIVVTA